MPKLVQRAATAGLSERVGRPAVGQAVPPGLGTHITQGYGPVGPGGSTREEEWSVGPPGDDLEAGRDRPSARFVVLLGPWVTVSALLGRPNPAADVAAALRL